MKSASDLLVVLAVTAAIGALGTVSCRTSPSKADAHAGREDREDPMRCAQCHTPEFDATKHPPHAGARPITCGVCHTQTSWHRWRVEHPGWELTGAHLRAAEDKQLAGKENQVKCFWCHRGDPSTYKDTKKECVACHEEDREDVKVPGHDEFGTDCETCHSTESWKGAKRPARAAHAVDAGAMDDASSPDAGAKAVAPPAKPKPVVITPPKPKPTTTTTTSPTTTTKPPDVVVGPSRRRLR